MIEENVKQLLGIVLGISPNDLSSESSMDTVESWDSLSQMNLVLALEDEFGIEIPDLEIQNMLSVNLIVLLVQELLDQ